jgi:hypothetical protein
MDLLAHPLYGHHAPERTAEGHVDPCTAETVNWLSVVTQTGSEPVRLQENDFTRHDFDRNVFGIIAPGAGTGVEHVLAVIRIPQYLYSRCVLHAEREFFVIFLVHLAAPAQQKRYRQQGRQGHPGTLVAFPDHILHPIFIWSSSSMGIQQPCRGCKQNGAGFSGSATGDPCASDHAGCRKPGKIPIEDAEKKLDLSVEGNYKFESDSIVEFF